MEKKDFVETKSYSPSIRSPTAQDGTHSHRASAFSSSSNLERIEIEPYDEFAEPIELVTSKTSHIRANDLSRHVTGVSIGTTATTDPRYEIDFAHDDRANPKNWPVWKLGVIIFTVALATLTVVLYSTSYTSGIPGMMEEFHVSSKPVAVLGLTTYLLGLAAGSVVLAPLSEMYGRRPVYVIAMSVFTVLVIPCALAKNLATILTVRFFGAFAGSVTISNAPGSISDIVKGLWSGSDEIEQ